MSRNIIRSIFAAAAVATSGARAETESFGGYTWTCRSLVGGMGVREVAYHV